MLLLAVDTAGTKGSVSLAHFSDGSAGAIEVLGTRFLEPRKFSTQLLASIAEVLAANNLELSEVDAFAVVAGPGSFTGLRVGLSAVKAMVEVTAKPVIAVSQLAMMAAAISSAPEFSGNTVHAVLDAGRGEFYHGRYRNAGQTCIEESLQTLEDLAMNLERFPGTVVALEPAVVGALHSLAGTAMRVIAGITVDDAFPLIQEAWRVRRLCDVVSLDANYLRRIEPRTVSVAGRSLKAAHS